MKQKLYSSVFKVILWLNLFSIAAVSLFNYFVFHRISDDAYLKSFIEYSSQVTDLAFHNIDKQIMMSVYHISQLHFSPIEENEVLLHPQQTDISASPQDIMSLTARMRTIRKTYPYVESIDIYYEGTGMAVTGFDKVHFPDTEEKTENYLPWLEQWKKEDLSRGFLDRAVKPYAVEKPVLTYVEKVSQPKWKGKSVYLAVHIAQSSFGEYIGEQDGALAILEKDGDVVYDTSVHAEDKLSIGAVMAVADREGISFEGDGEPAAIDVSGTLTTVFHKASPDTGLLYLYRIADSSFYEEYHVTKRLFLIGYVVSIGFNLLVLLFITYYNHTAYRRRVLEVSKGAGIELPQESKSFEGSLRMLSKEISALHQSIDSSKSLLFQGAVRSMILNKGQNQDYDKLDAYLTGEYICALFFYLRNKDAGTLSVESLQEEYEPGKREYNVVFTTMENDSLVAILIGDEKGMKRTSKEFIKEMETRFAGCQVVQGLPCPSKGGGAGESYKTAVEASGYRYIYTNEPLLSYDILQPGKRKSSGSHLKLFEVMEKDIKNENFLDFKTRMEGVAISFKSGDYSISYCNSTLRDLVTLFYQLMQQYQLDMWVVFGYDIREYYKQIPDIAAFCQWANYLCEIIIRNIQQKKQVSGVDMKERLVTLIEEHLESSISLDYLADELHMRPDAVSRMFRQIMGKGYAEYIKERKLDRAIELMDEGRSVKDIAEQLGYSSAQYFIKVFKEAYGITPYQFKKDREKDK